MGKLGSTTPAGWMLQLVHGTKKHLDIQYGLATFDGCGTEGARDVRIGGGRGILITSHHTTGWWTELVWPATLAQPFGRYGLAGNLAPARMLRTARSMPPVRAPGEVSHNC